MKLFRPPSGPFSRQRRGLRPAAGFSMVELALCIAIVAFALVAIIGVLPSGLTVQQQNREDTIITQDAQTLIETIRTGAMRFDDLTNYVDFITVAQHEFAPDKGRRTNSFRGLYCPDAVPALPGQLIDPLLEAEDIVGLLSLKRFDRFNDRNVTNFVTAQFRAFSGPLSDKVLPRAGVKPTDSQRDFAFRYRLTTEIVPILSGPNGDTNDPAFSQRSHLAQAIYDVRLTFQWPVLQVGDSFQVGNNRRTFRTQVSGQLQDYPMFRPPTVDILGSGLVRRRFNTGSVTFP